MPVRRGIADFVPYINGGESGDPEFEKESRVSSVLLEWGSRGKIAYVDGVPAGYMLFAPPQYVPRSIAFPASPVSADTAMFMPALLLGEFAGGGIGRMLAQAMAKDLTRRGVRAAEAFGDRRWESPALSARCERWGGEP